MLSHAALTDAFFAFSWCRETVKVNVFCFGKGLIGGMCADPLVVYQNSANYDHVTRDSSIG